ncbi:MAG: glycosyltransferase family 39 protein [Candidatus Omnitrophica bacterium]|nr:glycosyltransferase family 39 protein [Candidatus Omnitrophota bacterium]
MTGKVLSIFAIGLILRLVYVLLVPQVEITSDAKGYSVLAYNLATEKGYEIAPGKPDMYRPPGYPFFICAIYRIFGLGNVVAVRIVQSVLTALMIPVVYLIAERIFNARVGLISAVITCFYPAFIGYSGYLSPQTVTAFLLPLFILSIIFFRGQIAESLGLGVLAGYACLVRSEQLLLFIILFFMLLSTGSPGKRVLRSVFIMAVAMLLVISVWTFRNYKVSHRIIPISSHFGDTVWLSTWKEDWQEWHTSEEPLVSILKGRDFAEADRDLLKAGMNNLREHPFIYLKMCCKRPFRFWLTGHSNIFYSMSDSLVNYLKKGDYLIFFSKLFLLLVNSVIVFLGFYGIRAAYRQVGRKRDLVRYLIMPVLFYAISHFFTFATPRYSIPAMPFVIILASCSIVYFLSPGRNYDRE